ncbi:MAG: ABC transporter ATP-binding protein [Burkholderiales bacterium]|nr:ABC transporter ATP-binding protein [Burkholderiales bacterium]OJX05210.1 MAG: microcin ABC transporter ATP-binding protein [Burkholderiales bacterium 70-64]
MREAVRPDAAAPLLAVEALTVDFVGAGAATRVVDGIDFRIAPGEKFALVGESGSGKTVSALSLLRLNTDARYGGRILFEGRDLLACSEREMRGVRGRDIAMIFQEPMSALNPLYPIGRQICEAIEEHEGLTRAQATRRAVELLARTRVPEPQRRFASFPHQLSGGQRQRAMIAMALACRPRLLVADEPTTALDVTIQRQIVALLDELQRETGMAVLLITHDLPLVRSFAGRVAVMKDGRIVEQGATAEVFANPRSDYTRLLVDSRPRRSVAAPDPGAPPLLEARALSCSFRIARGWFAARRFEAVREVDLRLPRGQTLGVVGESGSGKTTLGLALLRLARSETTGEIRFDGQRIDALRPRALRGLRRRMQIVFQDPFNSLSPRRTVLQIVEEGLALHRPELSAGARRDAVVAMLEEVGLGAATLGRYPHEFSGGQRQRVSIARAAVLQPELIVLDEPTSALDVSVQQQVLQLLAGLQRRHGLAYVFITHDLEVIRAMAHHVVVMKDGRIVEAGETEALFAAPREAYTRELCRNV